MRKAMFFSSALILAATAFASPMMTPWGEKVTSENAWRDYPRPQMARESWTCLNGDWDYKVTKIVKPDEILAQGKIRVPFAIESVLSGVGRLLEPDEYLEYSRTLGSKAGVIGNSALASVMPLRNTSSERFGSASTVTVQVALAPLVMAVITAVPGAFAVTTPSSVTEATA